MARKVIRKRRTNTQFIRDLMEGRANTTVNSVLMQMFIIDSVTKLADKVAALTDEELAEQFKDSMVHGPTWRETARQIKREFDAFYER